MDSRRAVREWDSFLRQRANGYLDFQAARDLLTYRYAEDELPREKQNRDGSYRECARYEAEREFFDCSAGSRRDVENLLARIVDQRYREYDDDCDYVSLKGIPARRFIAAERLFQRKLMMLAGKYHVCVGLDVGSSRSSRRRFGPVERFRVHHACEEWPEHGRGGSGQGPLISFSQYDFECSHRSETPNYARQVDEYRVGDKFAWDLGKYADDSGRKGIVSLLADTLHHDLHDRPHELARVFREFCSNHSVSNKWVRKMEWEDKKEFLNACFLILECEQSQWQSAFYMAGDQWKLGMSVSFARLVKLLEDDYISLNDMFFKYALYSNQNLRYNFDKVRKTCSDIDRLYQSCYRDLDLENPDEAYDDLTYLYGKRR
ncbi:uncharacterized protein LOC117648423 [Thrips palmi]|uniref:Uncharacterized protein LOC117648423 n=1 Tax=Thrips palmi TaxID=161013 RepID=A0A6P8Z8Y3_THRPL|nr:uncharacterized protein LOC117648423 [Thrips palmi]